MPPHPQREAVLNAWHSGTKQGVIVRTLNIGFGSVSSIVTRARAAGDERAAPRKVRDEA